MEIINFDQSNARGVVYAAQDRGVITRWQLCNDRRLACPPGSWEFACVGCTLVTRNLNTPRQPI